MTFIPAGSGLGRKMYGQPRTGCGEGEAATLRKGTPGPENELLRQFTEVAPAGDRGKRAIIPEIRAS